MKSNQITINALGIALYVVFSLFLPIRVLGNFFLCFGYIVMVVYPYVFGPLSGFLVGLLGTAIYCLIQGSYNGMIGWTIGNAFIGIFLGKFFPLSGKISSQVVRRAVDIVLIVLSSAIAFLIIKPFLESVLFSVPLWERILSNSKGFILDGLVMIAGYPLAIYFKKHIKRKA